MSATARVAVVQLPPELFAKVIPHGQEDRERFFGGRQGAAGHAPRLAWSGPFAVGEGG